MTLALFAFLAAVFVRLETKERALREDFRRRALASLAAVVLFALLAGVLARSGAPRFAEAFGSGRLAVPLTVAAAGALVLIPCLYVLFRVFKGSGKDDAHEGH